MHRWIPILFLAAWFPGPTAEASAMRTPVSFSVVADVGVGNEVCVAGDHALLGGGDVRQAVKLAWTEGNIWRGTIALTAGDAIEARFLVRDFGVAAWPSTNNATTLGAPFTTNAPAHPAPPWTAKTVWYRTAWAAPRLLYRDRTAAGVWTEHLLTAAGPGRMPGEITFQATGLAPSGHELEFVFHDGAGVFDNAPPPPSGAAQGAAPATPAPYQGLSGPYNYHTPLDVFLVQDGQIFNYIPSNTVTAPRFETRQIESTVAGIPGRPITLLLPRGYDQHTGKRYPVLYFHDGQNVFFPGGPFGTWDADRISTYETAQGRMREAILVAIPNGNDYGSNRIREYLPTGDTLLYAGTLYEGAGAAYGQFLIDNVMPTLDTHYRTRGGAADTLTAGSSMGGLVADYLTDLHTNHFGIAGIFSPAYWAAPLWTASRDTAPRRPLRRYLYMGTAESSTGESSSEIYWRGALHAYDGWVRLGHVLQEELRFEGGAGAAHNEAAWSTRLPAFLAFALDPQREAQPLALTLYPPALELAAVDTATATASLVYTGLLGVRQTLETGANLQVWQPTPLPPEHDLWRPQTLEVPLAPTTGTTGFWRVAHEAWAPTTP